MTTVDLMIVQTALPSINDTFAVSPNVGQWLVLAYAGTMVALQLPAGRWLDGVSPRAGFVFAIVAFTVTSVLCALAPTVGLLIAARALQGAAGAVLGALVPGLVIMSAAPQHRGRAMGIVGTLGPLGGIFGPAVGGVLLAVWDWRAIFLVNGEVPERAACRPRTQTAPGQSGTTQDRHAGTARPARTQHPPALLRPP